jgi:hypothetical protein
MALADHLRPDGGTPSNKVRVIFDDPKAIIFTGGKP